MPGCFGGDTCEGHIFITAWCSWRGHMRGAHIHYCSVFLERTPVRGTYSLLRCSLRAPVEEYISLLLLVFLEGTPVRGTYSLVPNFAWRDT
ncbi:hypothetical protein Tco_1524153 [Tanacetum coccineum]